MSRPESPAARRFDRTGRHVALLVFCVGFVFASGCQRASTPAPVRLAQVKAALAKGDFGDAEKLALKIPRDSSERSEALALAGEAAAKDKRPDDAAEHYQALSKRQRQSAEPPLGLFYAAEVYRNVGRLSEAETCYRQFLAAAPNHTLSHERLAFLTSVSGRRWESVPHYFFLIRSGTAQVLELVLFGDLDRPIEQRPYLEKCAKTAPNDFLVRLGLAAHTLWEGRAAEALPILQQLVKESPDVIAAQAMLGELLVHASDEEFVAWHRRLPAQAMDDPDIHFIRGLWARKHNQLPIAARCFWESIRRAPTHRRATFQLGQVLRSLDHPGSEAVEARSKQLIQLTQLIDQTMRTQSQHDEPFRGIAELLENMGRIWEAAAWGLLAQRQFPQAAWTQKLLDRVGPQLTNDLPLVLPREDLALKYDLSSYPDFSTMPTLKSEVTPRSESHSMARIRFQEVEPGMDFTYVNGHDPATPGARMFEQTGGGVAVLDYDGDLWPDLFFSQGGEWKTGQSEPEPPGLFTDRLFRNLDGQQGIDVTQAAGLIDRGFGQGAAVGDFDNDGFPDLYVGNVGRNQLLRNNGDGTFADVTEAAGIAEADWTSSCVMVDLNADGHPDLYDVNYVVGPQVYERICQGKACSPSAFAGAPDRLLISRGDGTFELVPPFAPEVDGKGLGVVAVGLHERDRPCLFIANDQVPNFLLRNQPASNPHNIQMTDEAFVSGVAFNQDGLAMASMGIAADDADGDGRIDFYVSTYKDESSMLLLQDSSGLFVESATTAGLRAATWPFVGWGTQFLDADRDGHPDLVGVNGHVDDYRGDGGEYHMRPQFFQNIGFGRFEERIAAEIGPFFEKKRLGRGLSRLDWNRDGLMDFAVSHMGDRASLVMNATEGAGHFVDIRLTARHSARDAIGAAVEVRAGQQTWRKQLVAGDGYMASNERRLQFGLGDMRNVDEITVQWPSGSESSVQTVPADVTLHFIESAPQAIQRSAVDESQVIPVMTGCDS